MHGSNLHGLKAVAYKYLLRHVINRNVEQIRNGRVVYMAKQA